MAILYDNEGNQITMSEVKSNASDISDLKSRMTSAEGDIDSVEGNITSLDGRLDTAEPKITTLENTSAALVDNKEILGAKNLLPLDLATIKTLNTTGTWVDNVYTISDITYTVNTDGYGNVTDITVNGTASDTTDLVLKDWGGWLASGNYILSGCPEGGGLTTYTILLAKSGDQQTNYFNEGGDTPIEIEGNRCVCRLYVKEASNIVLKPMIRLATDNNPTFEPYAMSNQELTAKVLDLITRVTALEE